MLKKISLVSLGVATALSLSACQSTSSSTAVKNEPVVKAFEENSCNGMTGSGFSAIETKQDYWTECLAHGVN